MELNAKLRMNNDSERQTENDFRYRTKDKQRLWMPNWRYDSEHQDDNVALNAEQKKQGSGGRNENVALNAKRKMNNDSERQTKKVVALMSKWKCTSECQTKDMALNATIKKDGVIKCQNEIRL